VTEEELLAVGRVSRAHGVRGEVAVQSLTEVEERFASGSVLRLEDGRRLTVQASRPHHHSLLVKFAEVPDRTTAEALRGQVLLVEARVAPPIDENDRFWVHQVVGLEVATEDGRQLGRVLEVQANPANDLWVTDTGAVIPAIRQVVVEVDLGAGRVVIRPIPGLLEEGG
jgi:16S rRNA processing protein RimM